MTQKKWLFILYTTLDILFALGLPILFISIQYDLFQVVASTPAHTSATGWGIVVLIAIVLSVIKRLKVFVKFSKSIALKYLFSNFTAPFFLLLFYLILTGAENNIDKLEFISLWSGITNAIALIFRFLAGKQVEGVVVEV